MGKSWKLFTLFGFKVRLHISWLIIAVLLAWSLAQGYFPFVAKGLSAGTYWVMGIVGTIALFLCVVLHEFGHSIVARKYGLPMKGITLFIFGGVAEMEDEPQTPKTEFMMAIAGPAVSVVLGAIFYLFSLWGESLSWPMPVNEVLYYLGWINGVLAAFNLIPAFPLDGGRVLRSFLWSRRGNLRTATRTAAKVGSGFGMVLIGFGVLSILFGNFIGGIWWFLIGMFLRSISRSSYQEVEMRKALEGEPIQRFMKRDPVTVSPAISVEELVQDYIYKYHFQMFPVINDSKLVGCVGTEQVKNIPKDEWQQHSVQEVLAKCSADNTIGVDTDAVKVLGLMRRTGNSRLMVLENGQLAGVVSLKDLLHFLSIKVDLESNGKHDNLPHDQFTKLGS